MGKKPLGPDKFGVQKVMRKGDYFADSLGQFALNSMSGLVGQLTYFYTDKAAMAAGAVATVFFICKILDAFTDVIMGHIVDHTKPGKEKYRPWILKMSIPAAAIIIMLFTVPQGFSDPVKIAYMFITNILLTAVVYTAIAIPYTSLQVVRTNSQEERGNMGIWRAAAGYISGMIIAIGIIPITNALGGDQAAWIKFGIGFALMVLLALLICYKKAKECAVESGKEAVPEEQQDDKYGKKMVGTSNAASGFGGKVGTGLGASVVGWCLAVASYDGLAQVATPAVRQAVFTFGIYIPLFLFLVMFILTLRFDLEAKLPGMREEVAKRKANQ